MHRGGDEKETERETDNMKAPTKVRSELKISFVQEVAEIHLLFVFVERSLGSFQRHFDFFKKEKAKAFSFLLLFLFAT